MKRFIFGIILLGGTAQAADLTRDQFFRKMGWASPGGTSRAEVPVRAERIYQGYISKDAPAVYKRLIEREMDRRERRRRLAQRTPVKNDPK